MEEILIVIGFVWGIWSLCRLITNIGKKKSILRSLISLIIAVLLTVVGIIIVIDVSKGGGV
jgi:uncharacterized membrane protein YidH (DUF202 family)